MTGVASTGGDESDGIDEVRVRKPPLVSCDGKCGKPASERIESCVHGRRPMRSLCQAQAFETW